MTVRLFYFIAVISLKQVDFDRENLLTHPLVKELINYKWTRIAVPGFLIYLGFYLIFLILLTSFALTLPPPGTYMYCVALNTSNLMIGAISTQVNETSAANNNITSGE